MFVIDCAENVKCALKFLLTITSLFVTLQLVWISFWNAIKAHYWY